MKHKELSIFFDSVASKILIYAMGILPVFFLPFFGLSIQTIKIYFFSIVLLLVFLFWFLARIYERKVSIPRSNILLVFFGLNVWFIIASIFSRSFHLSFFGRGFEFGTGVTFFGLFLLLFFSLTYVIKIENIKKFLSLFFLSASVVFLWQFITLFLSPGSLFLGIPLGTFTTLFGSWNDFGVFSGFIVLLISVFVIKLPLRKSQKIFCYSMFGTALLFVVLFNNPIFSFGILFLSLLVFTFEMSKIISLSKKTPIEKFPLLPTITILILLFTFSFPTVINSFRTVTHTNATEVVPTTAFTSHIFKETFKDKPFFGSGLNNFQNSWMQYRPEVVNKTKFSDVAFTTGSSTVSTLYVTAGLFGGLLMSVFLILCLIFCKKVYFRVNKEETDSLLLRLLVFSAFFFIVFSFVMNLGFVLWACMIFSIGSLFNLHKNTASKEPFVFKLDVPNKKVSTFLISLCVLFCLIIVLSLFFVFKKTIALGFAEHGNRMLSVDLLKAEESFKKALLFDGNDLYYRNLLKLYSDRIERLITSPPDATKETIKNTYEKLFDEAVVNGEKAYAMDPYSLDTLLLLARLYQMTIPLGREDAYTKSMEYFKQIDTLFPKNQTVLLSMAKTEFLFNNTSQATQYIQEALAIRNDNPDAYVLGARILYQAKNVAGAKEYLNQGLSVMPNNAMFLFNYGLIEFTDKKYELALPYFEQSLIYDPDSVPTRYYFGVTYFKLDKKDKALEQFKILASSYPENKTIKILIANVENNRDILTGINQAVLDPITDSLK